MHIIAYIYHWEHDTVMKLPCKERKMWVDMINLQKQAEGEAMKKATKKK